MAFLLRATEWNRTINPRFTKAVLYQLSYGGVNLITSDRFAPSMVIDKGPRFN